MRLVTVSAVAIVVTCTVAVAADVQQQMRDGYESLQAVLPEAEALVLDGRLDEANKKIVATFPDASRTPAQALLLGNVLFRQDPQTSYALHKSAAAALPGEPMAQIEWAMEQHRAGEYGAAAESYAGFLSAEPAFGPALGLRAECLIRTGKTAEAVRAWEASEEGHGSLEQFESWVCELHTHSVPDRERATLLAKAKEGDGDAAERLVALDCNFPRDWWNSGSDAKHLAKDLEVLRATKLVNEPRWREIECAAECGRIEAGGDGDVAAVLRSHGFLLDESRTLPASGRLLAPMLSAALAGDVLSKEGARNRLGLRILDLAAKSADAQLYNAAAHLYVGTDRLAEIDQLGWEATGDEGFAASRIVGLAAQGKLTLDDPLLNKARRQFPENAEIQRVIVRLTREAGKPLAPALVDAIKAEFSHFSVGSPLQPRPSAAALRTYFRELGELAAPAK